MSFVALLDESMRRCPDEVALIDGSRRWNYSAFSDAVRDAARGLTAAGVMQGDRLALHTLNWFEQAVLYFACARLGVISVPVNTGLKPPEIDFVLRHCGVSTYIGPRTSCHRRWPDPSG